MIGEVGHETRIPEDEAHGEISGDREHVEDQGREEVGPQPPLVWIGQYPVG